MQPASNNSQPPQASRPNSSQPTLDSYRNDRRLLSTQSTSPAKARKKIQDFNAAFPTLFNASSKAFIGSRGRLGDNSMPKSRGR